jgi:hypothetical protein
LTTTCFSPLRKAKFPATTEISAGDAEAFLTECIDRAERYLADRAHAFTTGRWIHYLRHLPPQVFDIVGHEEGVRARHMAETLAAMYGDSDATNKTPFWIDRSTVEQILRFSGMAFHLDSATGHLQWRGTDVSFKFGERPLPDPAPSDEVRHAVDTFVQRLDAEELSFAGLGSFAPAAGTARGDIGILLAYERPEPVMVGVNQYLLRPRDSDVEMDSYFDVRRISAREPIELLSHESIGDAPLLPGFYASLCVLTLALLALHASEGSAEFVLDHGYLFFDRKSAELLARDGLSKLNESCKSLATGVKRATNLDELISIVAEAKADVRRLRPGPLMLATGERVLLDVASATQRMFIDAEYPSKVEAGKEHHRSDAFELATQRTIDSTPWRPIESFHALRGKPLRSAGLFITDIDALGQRNDTLLLVSCKSIPFSGAVDVGRRQIIRNIASKIADYEAEWRGIVERITSVRKGDNFDFSSFSQIVGVVVTPHIFFVVGDQLFSEPLPGLRAYSSLSELKRFLQRP